MKNLIDQDGVLYSTTIQRVKGLDAIEHLSVSGKHVFARSKNG